MIQPTIILHPQWVPFDKFNNWNATDIVAISEESKNFILEKEKADPKKVTRIHHGISINHFTTHSEEDRELLRNKYSLHGRKVIGTVARLIEWKGYKQILEAAEIYAKGDPSCLFLFIGVGPQEEELRQIVQEKGLSNNVIFTGWVDRKLIPSLFSLMDVYLHAANYEPFGFVIAEAMVNGLPIVSTPTGAALDAIQHKENGYLAEQGNPQDLVEGIEFLLSSFDQEKRADIKKQGLNCIALT